MTARPPVAIMRAPQHVVFGRDSAEAVGPLTLAYGRRALLCTDAQIAATDILRRVTAALNAHRVTVEVFAGGEPDLPVHILDDAVEAARAIQPDVVIGVGGGSSIDLAKLTALLFTHPGSLSAYYGENRVPGRLIPIVGIPTTAGTGSEVTPVAVVSDPLRAMKVGVSSPHLIPAVAICDPSLTDACPAHVTAHAGIDALAHAVEAFTAVERAENAGDLATRHVFVGKNALSDSYALEAVRLIGRSLVDAVRNPGDEAARDEMALGSLLAGLAFASAGTAAAHALQYALGANTSTTHGLGTGLLLPYVVEFNRPYRINELAALASAFSSSIASPSADQAAQEAVAFIGELASAIGIPRTLAELGVDRSALPSMAEQAFGITRLIGNNPRPLERASLLQILDAAWRGDMTGLAKDTAELVHA